MSHVEVRLFEREAELQSASLDAVSSLEGMYEGRRVSRPVWNGPGWYWVVRWVDDLWYFDSLPWLWDGPVSTEEQAIEMSKKVEREAWTLSEEECVHCGAATMEKALYDRDDEYGQHVLSKFRCVSCGYTYVD